MIKIEAENILKYEDLTVQIQCELPVIIGTSTAISKLFRKYLSNIPGKELQKAAIACAARILRKVQNVFHGK